MKWEELKVYKPLNKEELKSAFNHFTKIIAENLKPFGFSLYGRKLIAVSNDLLHIIHIDTRGSWSGVRERFKTEISLVAVSDKSPFKRGFELTGSKKFENIVLGIRNNNRITKEYPLLADFLTRKIIDTVLPYFDKYDSSKKVLKDRNLFKLGDVVERNDNLILFCELQNNINIESIKIVDRTLAFYSSLTPGKSQLSEYFEELEIYMHGLKTDNWAFIEQKLTSNKNEVFKKLKIKPEGDKSIASNGA